MGNYFIECETQNMARRFYMKDSDAVKVKAAIRALIEVANAKNGIPTVDMVTITKAPVAIERTPGL